ncbi:hypothetical protein SAMN05421638_1672 [Kaistella treverensis]|uniref:Uncharacterized protein n=1 Tax=Kaistella treverensis TaxID=631455 RepID=A0A1I3MLU0_9FLAO|nr:hypothetical protein [Kaistella treverensis]SFI97998.1 hypothetical protein SAMN05421638_1672 [Kaistella treverensis]
MDEILLIGLFILVFVGLPIGLGLLLYFIPKKFGHPKTGKYLTIIFGVFILSIVPWTAFEDQLFTTNNAKELVEEQQIFLKDKFDLQDNKSMLAIGDYYHTFTLKISARDKQNAIFKIKNSDNFKTNNSSVNQMLYLSDKRYFGPKVTQNYETSNAFVREYFQPSGQEGYAPTFRRISINKDKNELTFEDIDE